MGEDSNIFTTLERMEQDHQAGHYDYERILYILLVKLSFEWSHF